MGRNSIETKAIYEEKNMNPNYAEPNKEFLDKASVPLICAICR